MLKLLKIGVFVLCLLCAALAASAATGDATATTGTVSGILTAKSANSVDVKADGATTSEKYVPFWKDGGYDKAMLETISKLSVSNRVTLNWEQQEHKRIVSITVVKPTEKTGEVTGVVTAKEKTWVDVKADGADGVCERYMTHWLASAGGMDPAMLKIISTVKVGDQVKVTWSYDERKRLDALVIVAASAQSEVRK